MAKKKKIQYQDKIKDNPNVVNGKWTHNDANEVKEVVNNISDDVDALARIAHTHNNKNLLDNINQDLNTGASPTFLNVNANDSINAPLGNISTVNANAEINTPLLNADAVRTTEISSESFVSGFAGSGYRLSRDSNDNYHLELDRLTVRKEMDVYQLTVNEIRATNGSIWVSDGIETFEVEADGNEYICAIDSEEGSIYVPFVVNDIVRCQKYNGKDVKYYTALVTYTSNDSFTLRVIEGAGIPAPKDKIVRIGNTTNINRQGALYLTSSDSGAPYMDVIDGVNSASFAGKTKVRLGKLDGIIDADLGTLSGYGIYAQNGFFKGKFIAQAGSNVYSKSETNAQLQVLNNQISSKVSQTEVDNTLKNIVEIKDTRNTNQTPAWYFANYPKQIVREFKLASVVNLAGIGPNYVQIMTEVSWSDASGGAIIQTATVWNRSFIRSGTNDTWTVWAELETITGAQTKVNTAINNIQIGGRNLLRNTNISKTIVGNNISNQNNRLYDFSFGTLANIGLAVNDEFTLKFEWEMTGENVSGDFFLQITSAPWTLFPSNITKTTVTNTNKKGVFNATGKVTTAMLSATASALNVKSDLLNGTLIISKAKFEKGNKATDWTPAPEDIDANITALGTRVTNTETSITQTNTAIGLKADKTVTDSLGNRLSNAESSLTIQAGEIASKVSQTEVNSSVNNAINNLQIGGRNYLKNSRYYTTYSNNSNSYPINVNILRENDRIFQRITRSNTTSEPTRISIYNSIEKSLLTRNLTGKSVVISYTVRASHLLSWNSWIEFYAPIVFLHSPTSPILEIGTEWKTFSFYINSFPDINTSTGIRIGPHNATLPSGIINDFYLDICEFKIEEGNKATTWTPAPEDLEGNVNALGTRITNAESTITQQATLINLKVSQTEVDTAKNQAIASASSDATTKANNAVASAKTYTDSQITITNTAIGLKADKTVTDSLGNRLSTAEGSLTVQANQIASKVTQTEVNSSVNNAINSLKIGGRNLLINSKNEWVTPGQASGSAYGIYRNNLNDVFSKLVGKDVMLSFDMKLDLLNNTTSATIQVYGRNGSPKYELLNYTVDNVTSEWARYSIKVSIVERVGNTGNGRIEVYGYNNNANVDKIYLRNVKLEEGNKATDWTPAPEDIDNNITGLDTRITNTESSIIQQAGQIASKVSQTEVTNSVNTAINNLQIGGRNYLNTKGFILYTQYYTGTLEKGLLTIKRVSATVSTVAITSSPYNLTAEFLNGDFTFSGYVKINGAIPTSSALNLSGVLSTQAGTKVSNTYDPTTGYLVCVHKYTGVGTGWFLHSNIFPVAQNDIITISEAKFEKGNKATAWIPAVEDNDVSTIQIGSRNLLKNSKLIQMASNNGNVYPTTSINTVENGKEFVRVRRTNITSEPTRISIYSAIPITNFTSIPVGKPVVFSFRARASHSLNWSVWLMSYGPQINIGAPNIDIGTEWKTYYFPIASLPNISATSGIRFNPGDVILPNGVIGTFYLDICEFKIEEGNIGTEWTPAPEDVETRLVNNESSITQQALLIQSKVGQTEVTNSVNTAINNLQIGGENLIGETKTGSASAFKTSSTYRGFTVCSSTKTSTNSTLDTFVGATIQPADGTTYTVSFYARGSSAMSIGCYFYNPSNTLTAKSSTGQTSTGGDGNVQVSITTEWKRYWVTWTQTPNTVTKAIIIGRNLNGMVAGTRVDIAGVKFEEGNKATDWSPAPSDVERDITALGTRVTNTETSITQTNTAIGLKADRSVTDSLGTRLNSAEAKITPDAINLTVKGQVDNALLLSSWMQGKSMKPDVTFLEGINGMSLYNNSSSQNKPATLGRYWHSGFPNMVIPNTSNYAVQYYRTVDAITTPGLGGFTFNTPARAGAKFLTRLIMNVPIGYSVNFASNGTGDGSVRKWLTNNIGTGDFFEYIYYVECGKTGTFATTNFFNFVGNENIGFTAVIAFAGVFDITDVNDFTTTSQITSSFNMDVNKITLLGKEINMTGKVTFTSLDTSTQNILNRTDSWKHPSNTTEINGGKIRTGTITADKIQTDSLVTRQLATSNEIDKTTLNQNGDGMLRIRHPNGVVGIEMGLIGGEPKFIFYNSNGVKLWEGGTNGITNEHNVPATWTTVQLTQIRPISIQSTVYTPAELQDYIDNKVAGGQRPSVIGGTNYFLYNEGINSTSGQNAQYAGYHITNSLTSAWMPNGYYATSNLMLSLNNDDNYYYARVFKVWDGKIVDVQQLVKTNITSNNAGQM